jgi:transposase
MKKRARRSFSDEYRAKAVELVHSSGKSIAAVAQDLGVVPSVLSNWVRRSETAKAKPAEGSLTTPERDELLALRKEIRTLREEREILKKATAFFARESK